MSCDITYLCSNTTTRPFLEFEETVVLGSDSIPNKRSHPLFCNLLIGTPFTLINAIPKYVKSRKTINPLATCYKINDQQCEIKDFAFIFGLADYKVGDIITLEPNTLIAYNMKAPLRGDAMKWMRGRKISRERE